MSRSLDPRQSIRSFGRVLKYVVYGLFVLLVLQTSFDIFHHFPGGPFPRTPFPHPAPDGFAPPPPPFPGPGGGAMHPMPVPMPWSAGLVILSLLQFSVSLGGLTVLRHLCGHYEKGDIFSAAVAAAYQRLGGFLIALSVVNVIAAVARWLVIITFMRVPEEFTWVPLVIGLWIHSPIIYFVIGVFVLLLGRIMGESSKMAEDQALTI
jgi:hypothetical protein